MNMNQKVFSCLLALLCSLYLSAQTATYTLEQCREMAKAQNKQTQINEENVAAAKAMRQAAFANFFPKLSANAAYLWNQKDLVLAPDKLDTRIGTVQANGGIEWAQTAGMQNLQNTIAGLATTAEAASPGAGMIVTQMANGAINSVGNAMGGIYGDIRKELTFDIKNMFVVQAGVIQPIFMGGKLRELYRIAKANEQIAKIRTKGNDDDIIVNVDEAYWRVVSVDEKLKLANQYVGLLEQLEHDVQIMVDEGVATQSELLKVRVKLSEARMQQLQAMNGLSLSKMALAQICGMPLDEQFNVDSDKLTEVELTTKEVNMEEVYDNRTELQLLEQANNIAKSGVKLAASTLQPNIMASANYIWSNPSVFNGFQKKFDGFFNVGVVMNVPIAHVNDIFLLKAAKHKARTIELKLEESREKIELQTTQSRNKVEEANMKLTMARNNLTNADENLRMAKEAFSEGVMTSSELLGAQTAWLNAHSQLIDTAIEAKVCQLYFLKHTGNL